MRLRAPLKALRKHHSRRIRGVGEAVSASHRPQVPREPRIGQTSLRLHSLFLSEHTNTILAWEVSSTNKPLVEYTSTHVRGHGLKFCRSCDTAPLECRPNRSMCFATRHRFSLPSAMLAALQGPSNTNKRQLFGREAVSILRTVTLTKLIPFRAILYTRSRAA